jgi:hypothetical protein
MYISQEQPAIRHSGARQPANIKETLPIAASTDVILLNIWMAKVNELK